jgi:hypothetical protein
MVAISTQLWRAMAFREIFVHSPGVFIAIWRQRCEIWDTRISNGHSQELDGERAHPASKMADNISVGRDEMGAS